jgi:hypothetical protein
LSFWHFQIQAEQREAAQVPSSSFVATTAVAAEVIGCLTTAALKTLKNAISPERCGIVSSNR